LVALYGMTTISHLCISCNLNFTQIFQFKMSVTCNIKILTLLNWQSLGAHTIGQARCANFRAHIYKDKNIDASFARANQARCPSNSGNGDNNLAPLDPQTPTRFDNSYSQSLVNKQAILHSDQELYNGGSTDLLVRTYSADLDTFMSDFVAAIIKMGDIKPHTGSQGEIRKNCRRIN